MNTNVNLLTFVILIATALPAIGQEPIASVTNPEKTTATLRSTFLEDDVDISYQRRVDYAGGRPAIQEAVGEHLTYPPLAREYNREGTVILRLRINTRGQITDTKVVQSVGLGCDEEAKRVVSLLTDWIPAQQGLNLVPGYFYLPVEFSLL